MGRLIFACLILLPTSGRADDWPQWLGPQRDGIWRETGIVDKFPPEGPKVRWRSPVAGGYASPAVAEGRVVVTDWVPADGFKKNANEMGRGKGKGHEQVLCLNESD